MSKKNPNSPARLRSANRQIPASKEAAPLHVQVASAFPKDERRKVGPVLDGIRKRRKYGK